MKRIISIYRQKNIIQKNIFILVKAKKEKGRGNGTRRTKLCNHGKEEK